MREVSSLPPIDQPAHHRLSWPELAWVPLVAVALLAIYLPALGNSLVYDDAYLNEGLFTEYASIFPMRVRMLSYGSFVWLQALVGEGWWKQRLFNVVLHAGVVAALWALYREILRYIEPTPADDLHAPPPAPLFRSPALGLAIGFFALNPVAVYAVGYLIQRSIVMATLFTVLALWLFARGLRLRSPLMHALSIACYVLAILSKEHAVLAPLAAIPVYILAERPTRRRLAVLVAIGLGLAGIAAGVLYARYGEIIGKPFDEYSNLYLDQLARLNPGAREHAWGLSALNEAWLFFRYGIDWLLPWSGFMSINLRPPFPLQWLTFPQVLGILGYVGVIAGGFWLLLRYRDGRALAGVALLFPALLFATEFGTVWVQDPFALYRSYLWAIGVPGLVFFAAHGPSPRILLLIGAIAGGLLVWQALDRVISMSTSETVWSDAIGKYPDDPRSVGRFFGYLNRGTAYVDRAQYQAALRDFEISSRLGDQGMGTFNIGAILAAQRRPQEALAAFDRAEKEGYKLYNLPFQRGLAMFAMGRVTDGIVQMRATVAMDPPSPIREIAFLQLGRGALQVGDKKLAIYALQTVVERDAKNREARYLLGMAHVMNDEPQKARDILDALIREDPNASAFYARALANYALHRKDEAMGDIDAAVRMGLNNANVREWQAKIRAMH